MDVTKDRKARKICDAHQHRIDGDNVCELCAKAKNEAKEGEGKGRKK